MNKINVSRGDGWQVESQVQDSGLHNLWVSVTMKNCYMEEIYLQEATLDQIESLELQLTNIVAQLYAYRKEYENAD